MICLRHGAELDVTTACHRCRKGTRIVRHCSLQRTVSVTRIRADTNALNANYENVLATVTSIIVELSKGKVSVNKETEIQAEVGMTSLQVMEMVSEIEESFDISFPLNRLPDIRTVHDLVHEITVILER